MRGHPGPENPASPSTCLVPSSALRASIHYWLPCHSCSQTLKEMAFPFFSVSGYFSELKYSNDSHWANPVIDLTKDTRYDAITGSVGRVWYAQPVPLWDHATRELASFNTTFSFQITNGSSGGGSPGDGMARVTYHNDTMLLSVDLQIADDASYHISKNVDLRDVLPETVAVGFSAATGSFAELHQLFSWSFNSSGPEVSKKPPPPRTEVASAAAAPDRAHEEIEAHKQLHLPPQTLALVLVSGLLVLVLLLLIACNFRKVSRWCQQKHARGKQGCGPRRYEYCELVKATNNFDQQRKLGTGGSGEVYRGDDKGRLVAVKKLISIGNTDAEAQLLRRKEFETEVNIISRLRHRNLVRLFGWCDSRKGLLLVYELIPGGSLDKYLYNTDSERSFSWNDRYRVIIGLGKALGYLHGEHSGTTYVVHGDIKPSNIMLDEELNTKLGDFGLARLIDQGTEPPRTQTVMGTPGYIEPEFEKTGKRCKESDVYSFGIVLLEMVTGHGPLGLRLSQPLRTWVWEMYAQNRVLDAASATLRSERNDQQTECVLIVGLWCTQAARSERPTIAQAMGVLEHTHVQLPVLRPCHGQVTVAVGSLVESPGQSPIIASPILGELALVPSQIYTNTAPVSTTSRQLYSNAITTAEASTISNRSSVGSYTTCSASMTATTSLGVHQAPIGGNMQAN
ncbi:unnamed protein product [Urochloa decumbens]|uniref:Protein kinase domain-containing protein n=1 Tax=Urochloa decumbens TaxID=240449 RepID=A0ABC9FG10_9POAL